MPLQVRALVSVPKAQVAGAQLVPLAYNSQAPAPLHDPVCPQVDAADDVHSLSGSVPRVIAPQVPLAPPVFAALHASQSPAHAVLQQKPSTQFPEVHWLLAVHAVPVESLGTQALLALQ